MSQKRFEFLSLLDITAATIVLILLGWWAS